MSSASRVISTREGQRKFPSVCSGSAWPDLQINWQFQNKREELRWRRGNTVDVERQLDIMSAIKRGAVHLTRGPARRNGLQMSKTIDLLQWQLSISPNVDMYSVMRCKRGRLEMLLLDRPADHCDGLMERHLRSSIVCRRCCRERPAAVHLPPDKSHPKQRGYPPAVRESCQDLGGWRWRGGGGGLRRRPGLQGLLRELGQRGVDGGALWPAGVRQRRPARPGN